MTDTLPTVSETSRARIAKTAPRHTHLPPHRIELNLRDMSQLFNSMDPSPFYEKDLDHDAEEFILSWAEEFHRHEPVTLLVHLKNLPEGQDAQAVIEQAVHHYFADRARLNKLELKRLLTTARKSLWIGLAFLVLCTVVGELLLVWAGGSTWLQVLREGLTIAGWVAMWKPMELYLYEWWPVRRRGQIFRKLSHMHVEVWHKE